MSNSSSGQRCRTSPSKLRPPHAPNPNWFLNLARVFVDTSPSFIVVNVLSLALPISSAWYTVEALLAGKQLNCVVFGLMTLLYAYAWYLFVTHLERFYFTARAMPVFDTPEGAIAIVNVTDPSEPLSPIDFYSKIWMAVSDYFLFANQETVDYWNSLSSPPDTVESFEQAAVFLRRAIDQLPDSYTTLLNYRQANEREHRFDDKQLVVHRLFEGNIGYVRLKTFGRLKAVEDMRDALGKLADAGAYILDLRNNGGGLDSVGRSIFSMLADEGKFHHARSRAEGLDVSEDTLLTAEGFECIADGKVTRSPRETNLIGSKPLFVLVNNNSASASEILVAALKVARPSTTVVGKKTFGKGIGQIHICLDFGALLIVTSCAFLDGSGKSWHKDGIKPEVEVTNGEYGGDNQLRACLRMARQSISSKPSANT